MSPPEHLQGGWYELVEPGGESGKPCHPVPCPPWTGEPMSRMDLPAHLRGDGPCADCGTTDNIRWYTENVFWNRVVRNNDPDAMDKILCIYCFVKRVDEADFDPGAWFVIPAWHWETKAERVMRIEEATRQRVAREDELKKWISP